MKVLVTGGAGFIGSAFVLALEQAGHKVVVFDKLTYAGDPKNLAGAAAALVVGDVCSAPMFRRAVQAVLPDAIVHFAAESHVEASYQGRVMFFQTNVIGTETVLAVAAEFVIPVLHVSTDEVFGNVLEGYCDENACLRPRNPYAASKAAAEMVVQSYRECMGVPARMVRLSNCYGPRQHVEKLIPLTIARLVGGAEAVVHSDGKQTREWLHVEDAARGILAVLERAEPGTTWNLPGRQEIAVFDVVCAINAELGGKGRIVLRGDRLGGTDRRYGMSGMRADRILGWRPAVDFEAGLRQTVAWYLEHRERLGADALEEAVA